MIHNEYQQRGGEDAVVEAEAQLLAENGHTVVRYKRKNEELQDHRGLVSLKTGVKTGVETVWAPRSHREVSALIAKEKPDAAHFHNTLPLISPAAFYACAEAGVPVVQSLHNYRLLCPSATLMREGKVCEECLGRSVPWPAVAHACYRGSRTATAVSTGMRSASSSMTTPNWRGRI